VALLEISNRSTRQFKVQAAADNACFIEIVLISGAGPIFYRWNNDGIIAKSVPTLSADTEICKVH
jgi:hypothetical protein